MVDNAAQVLLGSFFVDPTSLEISEVPQSGPPVFLNGHGPSVIRLLDRASNQFGRKVRDVCVLLRSERPALAVPAIANPKSDSFAAPFFAIRIFAGLMSRVRETS